MGMDIIKKHVDTVIVLGGILASVLWMNGKFNDINSRFSELEKEVAIIKTVLIIKGILPESIAKNSHDVVKNERS